MRVSFFSLRSFSFLPFVLCATFCDRGLSSEALERENQEVKLGDDILSNIKLCFDLSKGMYPLSDPEDRELQKKLKGKLESFVKIWSLVRCCMTLQDGYKKDPEIERFIDAIHDNVQSLVSYADCDLEGDEYFKKLGIEEKSIQLIREVASFLSTIIWGEVQVR